MGIQNFPVICIYPRSEINKREHFSLYNKLITPLNVSTIKQISVDLKALPMALVFI